MKSELTRGLGSVAVIGVGTMGEAILKGLLSAKVSPPSRLHGAVRSEARAKELTRSLGIEISTDNAAIVRQVDTVVIALKPQAVLGALRALVEAGAVHADQLFISIAAGVSIAEMEETLGKGCAVIRAMPNTPCAIGRGTIVLAPGSRTKPRHLAIAHLVFDGLGLTLELEEKHFNTVTGLSGSGPAFGYIMIEALADGGVMMGLPRQVATTLAARTLLGAAEMVLATGRHSASLKDDVTTPAGCTIGGILALEDGGIRSTLARGVERAARLAADLGRPTKD